MTNEEYRAAALYVLQCALVKTAPVLSGLSMLDVLELTCDEFTAPLNPFAESEVFCLRLFLPIGSVEHNGRLYRLYEPRAQFGVLEVTHGVDE